MMRTPMGLALAPRRDGKVLTPELFEALPEAERERIQRDLDEVQGELETVMQKVPQWEREHREAVRELNRETTGAAIALMMNDCGPVTTICSMSGSISIPSSAISKRTPTISCHQRSRARLCRCRWRLRRPSLRRASAATK